jgi:uncharacterized protein
MIMYSQLRRTRKQIREDSPCIGTCTLNEDNICIGCGRHIDEIIKRGIAEEPLKG